MPRKKAVQPKTFQKVGTTIELLVTESKTEPEMTSIRLSRISHPRSSFAAMLLLVVVFLGFGVVAEACSDAPGTANTQTLSEHSIAKSNH